jgi:hypothetical protein
VYRTYIPVRLLTKQEFLPEGSLESLLRKMKVPLLNKVSIAMETAAGMLYLSIHRIVHRSTCIFSLQKL